MPEWTFVTNHSRVLSYIARYPMLTTVREMAIELDITERTVHKIITDLEDAGYITRIKVGRRNQYEVNYEVLSQKPTDGLDVVVADILKGLGWEGKKKRTRKPKTNKTVKR